VRCPQLGRSPGLYVLDLDERHLSHTASLVIVLAAIVAAGVGIVYGTYAAADTDPFGYVSEADLIAGGSLSIPHTVARQMAWPRAEESFTPAGYGVRADHAMVPSYAPGLPLVMAGFQRTVGQTGVFYVIPLLGALAILMTGRLGSVLGGSLTGATSAVLLASSPIFLHQIVQPVSDVATSAWWVTALATAISGGRFAALLAGLSASMAIVTRPNLVALAVVIAGYLMWRVWTRADTRRQELWRLGLFCSAVVPGCLFVAWFNGTLYGSPLRSGYGELSAIYAWSNLRPNLDRYPLWLVQSQSPLIVIGVLAPLVTTLWRRARPSESAAGRPLGRAEFAPERSWLLLVFAVAVVVSYLFYAPWDGWGYVRFLLPAIPAVIVLTVVVLVALVERLTRRWWLFALVWLLGVGAWAWWQCSQAVAFGAFTLWNVERRYVDVGRYIDRAIPGPAVFISGAQSGSILYYTGMGRTDRWTIQSDVLGPGWLDDVVKLLGQRGYRTYIVLEDAEEEPFRAKFGEKTMLGRLDWPPAVQRSEAIRVRIYDPADRTRFLAGEPIVTGDVHPERKPMLTAPPAALPGSLSRPATP